MYMFYYIFLLTVPTNQRGNKDTTIQDFTILGLAVWRIGKDEEWTLEGWILSLDVMIRWYDWSNDEFSEGLRQILANGQELSYD